MFTFDPRDHAATFAAQDYIYIRQGLSEEFYRRLCAQVDEYLSTRRLENFALGNKQQALYSFPDADSQREFEHTVAALSGLDPEQIVISERHIKVYESDAAPNPMPHKDRCATQLAVGFTVRNPRGSRLVIYPDADRGINPFQSWAELQAGLPPERLPPAVLRDARRVVFHDQPRDVMMFRGNEIWHARENGADTVMLYFKVNAFHSDPIGEDPRTKAIREETQRLARLPEEAFNELVPILARRVDSIQRRLNCLWQEVLGVAIADQPFLTIDEADLDLLRAMNGRRSVASVIRHSGSPDAAQASRRIRRLAERGIVDLLPSAGAAPPIFREETAPR
jgi:hypothetical protein